MILRQISRVTPLIVIFVVSCSNSSDNHDTAGGGMAPAGAAGAREGGQSGAAGAGSSAGAAGKGDGSGGASAGSKDEGGTTNGGSGASSGIAGQTDSGTAGVGTCSRTDSTCPAGLSCHCCPTQPRQVACICTSVCQTSATCSGQYCVYNFCADAAFCSTAQ